MKRDGKQIFSWAYQKGKQYHEYFTTRHTIKCQCDEQNHWLATRSTHSEVIALDFRGRGQLEDTPSDIKYSIQFVDDLEKILKSYSFPVEGYSSSDSNKPDSNKT